ncbi:MAG: GNAT family N-acetyltransferase [Candidatus Heimdallarchaeota archaeon]
MEIKIIKKEEINLQQIAELTYKTMKRNGTLTPEITEEFLLTNISKNIANHFHDSIVIAESDDTIVGWLAFYVFTDLQIAQIVNWHPVVLSSDKENEIATDLIRKAFLHLKKLGLEKVTIDFVPVNERAKSNYNRLLDWYAQVGLTEIQEESYYKKDITEETYEVNFPDNYTVGLISEANLDDVYNCWLEIFTSSNDSFFHSIDPKGRKDFFYSTWSKDKPLINDASFALYHKEKIIGLSRLLPKYEEKDGYLAPVGIIPKYRRKGLAEDLLKLSMQKLKMLNYKTMSFYVSSTNLSAISFYEKLGFKVQNKIASLIGKIV